MIRIDPATLADWTGGRLVGSGTAPCHGVSTDTRRLEAGNIFVCLRGPNFDGHRFAADAAELGASVVVTEAAQDLPVPQVVVGDAREALGTIGNHWRERFRLPVIAVTGSNGKTTVKECLAAILRQQGPILATRGNLNNDIGVPLMLCELGPEHVAAVFELGANHAGEIATLARLVRPAVGVLTNAGPAHLEGFGSIAGVARAKGELLEALPADGHAVYPADSEWSPLWQELAGAGNRLTFGEDDRADVRVTALEGDSITLAIADQQAELVLPLPGAHNRRNAAAAAAAAWATGVPLAMIAAGLAGAEPVAGRLVERRGPGGSRILDDSYNANPASFAAALAVIGKAPGRRWVVVGEMAELGDATATAHERLGADARETGIERLWALGPSAAHVCHGFGAGAETVTDLERLATDLRAEMAAGIVLLVKGSRSNALERLVEHLVTDGEG